MKPAYETRNPSFSDMTLEQQIEHGINDWCAEGSNDHPYFGQTKAEAEAIRATYEHREMARTPGPWFTEATNQIGHFAVCDSDGFTICNPSPMGTANARLVAAAPDLLRELQILADYAERNGARVGAARAAIAKATGSAA